MKFRLNLNKKISNSTFILSNIGILMAGLTFLFGLYYILNLQYPVSSKPFEKGLVTTAPKTLRLELEQPDNHALLFEPSVIVSGKTGPSLEVLIYSDTQNTVIKSKPDGSFSTVLNLFEGINQIFVNVFDATGDSKSDTRTVYYSKEKI